MRRPSPLPASAPPPEPDEAAPIEVVDIGPPRDAPASVVDEVDTADAAPSAAPAVGRSQDADTPHEAALSQGADAAPVVARPPSREAAPAEAVAVDVISVWKAARARRRALRAEMRRFTARRRRRRITWIVALSSVLLLVLVTLGVAYSPLFAVQRVSVVGTRSLDAATVEQALAGQIGTPLPLVDSSEVKAALVAFPLIETYTLEARPPDELIVRIVERTPVGQIASPAGYTLVDAAGVALSTTPEPTSGFPLIEIEGGTDSRVFEAVATVYRALSPEIAARVSSMTATTPNDVTLTLGESGPLVVWGNADRSEEKAVVLAATMVASPPDTTAMYDVSSPDAVVVR